MRILVGQNHMHLVGGSETFTYTLVKKLCELGHDVSLVTGQVGIMSDRLVKEFGISVNKLSGEYDLMLVNHNSIVNYLRPLFKTTKIIQTCHGIIPNLEQPSPHASHHVSISLEVQQHLSKLGFKSSIIHNGLDLDVFKPTTSVNEKLTKVLSLSQSEIANDRLRFVLNKLGVELVTLNKHFNPKMEIVDIINSVDLVIGLGRSAYEAMACGRPVFVWDMRDYMGERGDGFLTDRNKFNQCLEHNLSGRKFNLTYTNEQLINIFKEQYDSNTSIQMREYAKEFFNMETNIQKYLDI